MEPAVQHGLRVPAITRVAERWREALLYSLALLPALLLLRAVDLYAVDVPFMDDWQFVPLIEKVHAGEIPWSELVAPHDEHRIVLPRVLIVGTMLASGGNYRAQCFVTFGLVVALSFALLFLLRRTFGPGLRTGLVWGLSNVVLFSPMQWHNWLWPLQFSYFLPYVLLGLALAAFYSDLAPGWRVGLALICGMGASFSFVHGILVWPAFAPALWLDRRWSSPRARRIYGALWVGAGVLAAFLYFHGISQNSALPEYAYFHSGEPPSASTLRMLASEPVETLARMARFCAATWGTALARGFPVSSNLTLAMASGALLGLAGAALLVGLLATGRLGGPRAAWAVLLAHGFATASLVALGRVWGGPGQPLTPRYVTFGTFCLLPVVILACVAFVELGGHRLARDAGLVLCGALLAVLAVSWSYGLNLMGEWHDARMAARAAVHFSQVMPSPSLPDAGGRGEIVKAYATTLDRLGYWRPPLAKDLRLAQFAVGPDLSSADASLVPTRTRWAKGWIVRGRAHFGAGGRTPDAILVTSQAGASEPIIRALCETHSPPRWQRHAHMRDYQFAERVRAPVYGRFRCRIKDARIPPEERHALRFWALDFARLRVHRIVGEIELDGAS